MKQYHERIMIVLIGLSCSLLLIAMFASPSNILSSNMIFPRSFIVDDFFMGGSPLARALESMASSEDGSLTGFVIEDPQSVASLYAARGYVPLWFAGEKLTPGALYLLHVFNNAETHGLDPRDYSLATNLKDAEGQIALELLLTDKLLAYACDLGAGYLDPDDVYRKWEKPAKSHTSTSIIHDLTAFLKGSPWAGASLPPKMLRQVLIGFQPPHPDYDRLQESLVRHQLIVRNGGWPHVPGGVTLREGDTDASVALLRQRLTASGDLLKNDLLFADVFDQDVRTAVLHFQKRCGLKEDGVVAGKTLTVLNITAQDRVRCIGWNMERLRWLSRDLGDHHVRVNIPGYELQMLDQAGVVGSMAVIVGRPSRPTPVMSKNLSAMILNPYWNIPARLARYDVLPAVLRDSMYLRTRGIKVFSGWEYNSSEINTSEVCWQDIAPEDLSYRFRQDPGPRNTLGRIKFYFSNNHAVYLHDTNHRNAFRKRKRAMSSGCIRVDRPHGLATFLTVGTDTWGNSSYEQRLASGETMTLSLDPEVRIHLMYLTAFVDEVGIINFRPDIYKYDEAMARLAKDN